MAVPRVKSSNFSRQQMKVEHAAIYWPRGEDVALSGGRRAADCPAERKHETQMEANDRGAAFDSSALDSNGRISLKYFTSGAH
jgi:hypothetical protein